MLPFPYTQQTSLIQNRFGFVSVIRCYLSKDHGLQTINYNTAATIIMVIFALIDGIKTYGG